MEIIWEKILKIIKDKVTQQNFETWIQPLKIHALEGENIHLAVPNKFFRDWLADNYQTVIREAFSAVAGFKPNIHFLIDGRVQAPLRAASEKVTELPQKRNSGSLPSNLNPQYSFERFVVGPSNQFAHAACVAVAEQPAKNYNPLFIYGGVGLGKTHLLNAIGLSTYPPSAKSVLFVSAEEFMNELISCIRYDKMPKFREKYRNTGIDYLLIDDIQFIAGKERTQEEFFHTFNTLHDAGKQIVVTSDKFPRDIPNLESRLRSRFEWGLVADIQPPEMETKIAIIVKKAQENGIALPNTVAHFIASKAESSIRELEGYLVRIAAYASLTNREINMDLVKEVLNKIIKKGDSREITVDEIIKTVAGRFGIKLSDLKSEKKNKNLVLPRQITMYLSRKLTGDSFPDIGARIGGKDHSTVIYAYNKIKKQIAEDARLKKTVEEIEEILIKNG